MAMMAMLIPEVVQDPLMLPIVLALVVGALAYLCSRVSPLACKLLALVGSALVLWFGIAIAGRTTDLVFSREWISLTKDIAFVVDLAPSPLGMVVLIGGAAFSLLITIYSFRAMAGKYWEGKFYAYLLWALAGCCIVGLADNLLVLLVGWELVTLMLFLMVNQGRRGAEAGGAKTYGILGFADACLLLAIVLLVAEGGTGNLALTREKLLSASAMGPMGYFIYVLIMIAGLAKAGAIPLHTWIPSIAEDAPTPVMALLPAAMDKLLESDIVKRMNRNVREFDEYEENEQAEFYRCNHCNPVANLFPKDEIFWDDEHGWLCGRCLEEEDEAREAIADEKKLHDKGNL